MTSSQTATLSAAVGSTTASTLAYTVPPAGSGGGGSPTTTGPGVSISVYPQTIPPGGVAILSWSSSGASSITVTGLTSPAASGAVNVSPSASTTYTVTATNSAGSATQSVTLTLGPASSAPCYGTVAGLWGRCDHLHGWYRLFASDVHPADVADDGAAAGCPWRPFYPGSGGFPAIPGIPSIPTLSALAPLTFRV